MLTPVGDDVVLLDGTAAQVWELLEHPVSARELADRLAVRYAATAEQVLTDVAPTLLQLQSAGVVVQDLSP